MKKVVYTIIFLYSTVYAQTPFNNSNRINNISFFESKAFSRIQSAKNTAASNNFDVTYYRCEWYTDPAVRYISGSVTSYFLMTAEADNIVYDLSDSLVVDSVKQSNKLLSFSHKDNTVKVDFGSSIVAGTLDSVSIYYHGVPANSGFGSFINSVHDSVPVMWTLSEPYGARDWWPCKNGLDDKADSIDIYIITPSQYTAASNGIRQSETIEGNTKITHWKHRYPIATYLICMAVTNYAEFENHVQVGNVDLLMQTFCYPENLALFQQNTPLVLSTLQYYSNIFGPYPFLNEKYGQVQFGWGGGMEHQTSTFIVTPNEFLMAHELAHQWFGDKITCASWQDIWLNEGFATHLASMDAEALFPQLTLLLRKQEIEKITSLSGGSVFVDDTTNVNRIFDSRLTYTKGSHLLYMLRWILGDSVFFRGMRSYLNDPALAYGFATTKDFQRNLEKVSGVNLDYFFNEWFYGQGYPSYHVQWSQLDNNFVRIKINQVTSNPSVKFFELPVALQFKNANQQKTIVVNNKSNGEVFIRDIGFAADTVIIDPDYWLITANNTSEKSEENAQNKVDIFPLPFLNQFYINLRNFGLTNANLKIYDSKGSLMLKNHFTINNSLFFTVNTQNFARGIYFLKIETDNGIKFAKKLLKQ
jgi:aminopeptidase N